jgi:D-hexose-6-phosphate mutarotase
MPYNSKHTAIFSIFIAGIPIAFPQFADNGRLKLHGFARQCVWTLATELSDDAASEETGLCLCSCSFTLT